MVTATNGLSLFRAGSLRILAARCDTARARTTETLTAKALSKTMYISESVIDQWFAVQVWSGREQSCASHLRVRGYDVFLPCYQQRRCWSDRIRTVDRPLFAGYVFCKTSAHAIGKAISAPGVIRLVGDGQQPLPIPMEEIAALQQIVSADVAAEPWPFVQEGERVRIDVGPLAGVDGIVTQLKTRNRLIVSVTLLQRSIAVEVEGSWLSIPPAALIERLATV